MRPSAQELVDDFIIKLRMGETTEKPPDYDELFAGDPLWITESLGGMGLDGRNTGDKDPPTAFLHTLQNLGPAPET